jgi:hypothetical protein
MLCYSHSSPLLLSRIYIENKEANWNGKEIACDKYLWEKMQILKRDEREGD